MRSGTGTFLSGARAMSRRPCAVKSAARTTGWAHSLSGSEPHVPGWSSTNMSPSVRTAQHLGTMPSPRTFVHSKCRPGTPRVRSSCRSARRSDSVAAIAVAVRSIASSMASRMRATDCCSGIEGFGTRTAPSSVWVRRGCAVLVASLSSPACPSTWNRNDSSQASARGATWRTLSESHTGSLTRLRAPLAPTRPTAIPLLALLSDVRPIGPLAPTTLTAPVET